MNLKPNDIVEFRYEGGSNPGTYRKVLVSLDGEPTFSGYDITNPQSHFFRQYSKDKVRDLTLIGHENRINFAEARERLSAALKELSGEWLAKLYGKLIGSEDATWDYSTGEVVTVDKPVPQKFPVNLTFQVDVVINEESDSEENARDAVINDYLKVNGENVNDLSHWVLQTAIDHSANFKIRLLDS